MSIISLSFSVCVLELYKFIKLLSKSYFDLTYFCTSIIFFRAGSSSVDVEASRFLLLGDVSMAAILLCFAPYSIAAFIRFLGLLLQGCPFSGSSDSWSSSCSAWGSGTFSVNQNWQTPFVLIVKFEEFVEQLRRRQAYFPNIQQHNGEANTSKEAIRILLDPMSWKIKLKKSWNCNGRLHIKTILYSVL